MSPATHLVLADVDADKTTHQGTHVLCLVLHSHQKWHRRLQHATRQVSALLRIARGLQHAAWCAAVSSTATCSSSIPAVGPASPLCTAARAAAATARRTAVRAGSSTAPPTSARQRWGRTPLSAAPTAPLQSQAEAWLRCTGEHTALQCTLVQGLRMQLCVHRRSEHQHGAPVSSVRMFGSVRERHSVATVHVQRPSAASASAVLMATWLGLPSGIGSPTLGLHTAWVACYALRMFEDVLTCGKR
jgi:hypothetical protein